MRRILVVEDSPTQARQLGYILEANGYTIDVAVDGLAGLEAARANLPDLVISDILMPRFDGYELCEALKKDSRLSHIPVILLTSLSEPRDVVRGLQAAADSYLSKPVDEVSLVTKVEELLAYRDISKSGRTEDDNEVALYGETYRIESTPRKIIQLLLAIYEESLRRNQQLVAARAEQAETNEKLRREVVMRKEAEEKLMLLALYDPLTGLPNRRHFAMRFQEAIERAKRSGAPLGLLFIDLDGFKTVNDSLGHDIGDQLLVETANRLKQCVRAVDAAGRLGGDEFTVLLETMKDKADVSAICDRLLRKIAEPFYIEGHAIFLSTSIGVSIFPDDSETANELLRFADAAMYDAKAKGKNGFAFFSPSSRATAGDS